MFNLEVKQHWENIYTKKESDQLGWDEAYPEQSMELVNQCGLNAESRILCVGAGTSTFVAALLREGFKNLLVNDLSESALEKLRSSIKTNGEENVQFIVDDLTNPLKLDHVKEVDLWHDRAVLHFFLQKAQQDAYFDLLNKLVKTGGYAIIASFSLNGASTCSGLPIHKYDSFMLKERIGPHFNLLKSFHHIHKMPNGEDRDYLYTLFKRIS